MARRCSHPAGRAALAISILVSLASSSSADTCTGVTGSGKRFPICFDLGNRFSATAGSDGFGGAIALRHTVRFDDEPDLVWKLAHVIGDSAHATFEDRFDGVLYRGRFLRHARDGHIVIPIGRPKKIFLPFDVGGVADVGTVRWRPATNIARLGVVKAAPLLDFARTRGFGRRFAFGPLARWDVEVDRDRRALAQHFVSPFTSGIVELAAESSNGRMSAQLAVEAGMVWANQLGWQKSAQAEASVERIVLAINDRPIALTLGVRWESLTEETVARVGARIVLVQRRDPRVRL
jgi:hypothetical protein